MRMKRSFFFVILIFCLPISIFADTGLSLKGYYKNFFLVLAPPKIEQSEIAASLQQPMIGLVNNRLRLNLFYTPNSRFSANVTYDISPRIQDPSLFRQQLFFAVINPYAYRFDDLDSRLYPVQNTAVGSFAIFQNLDRAMLTIHTKPADIFIGRQAIAWGSARIVNPTDVVAPFPFEELDTEDRIGVDAIRLRIPNGFMGEFDTGYICGKDFKLANSAYYLRNKLYIWQADVSFLLLGFRQNMLAGLDIARSMGGAGFWLETAYVFVAAFDHYTAFKKYNYLRLSTGMDYSFGGKTYGFIEYHFNGAGAATARDYLNEFLTPAYTEGTVYLMGKHYLTPGLTYQITPLISFTGQSLLNLTDPSIFFSPQVEYNVAENIYVSGGAFFGIGKKPKLLNAVGSISMFCSEFGTYPNVYFTSFRIYF